MTMEFMQKPRQGYGHMVIDNLVDRLREVYLERHFRVQEALKSRRKAEAYRDEVKAKIQKIFQPLPKSKSPLNATVMSVTEYPEYRLERVVYDSRPDFPVTANLYVPTKGKGPFPAVLGSCGHSHDGKAAYQSFGIELVRAGFVVLIFDPLHQGERRHFWQEDGSPDSTIGPTYGHNRMARWLELTGDNFGNWRVWDAVRSLDYLLSRPEVDPERVGMTGNSGGGTMTTWVWPLEDRLRFAAPSCFVTRFLHNLENELPADAEQYPTGVFREGLEMADFLIARAPDPVLLLGQRYDFFDRRGFEESSHEVQAFYRVLGAGDKARSFMGNHLHGYRIDARHTMVKQFSEWAGLPRKKVVEATLLPEEQLRAGNQAIIYHQRGRTFHEFYRDTLEKLDQQRTPGSAQTIQTRLRKLLTLPKTIETPFYRILRVYPRAASPSVHLTRYAVETEDSIRAILWKACNDQEPGFCTLDVEKEVVLYLPHQSTEAEFGVLQPKPAPFGTGTGLYGLDYRGVGQSRYDENGDFFAIYGMEYMMSGHHLMFGESYLGKRVLDVISTLNLLAEEGAKRISIHGVGMGALIGLLVAALDKRVNTLLYENGPLAYSEFKKDPKVEWPVSNIIRGAYRHFDLPDIYRILGKRLVIRAPWNTQMKPYTTAELKKAIAEYGIPASLVRTNQSKTLLDLSSK